MAEKVVMANKPKKEKRGIFKRIGGFFKEVKVETFKRIIWPTPSQTFKNTVVVVVMVAVVGVFVWLLDYAFIAGFKYLLGIK